MNFVAFHINRAERSGRAEVLASTAADACLSVDDRNARSIGSVGRFHHLNGAHRAVAGAVSAFDTIGERDTVVTYPHGVSDLYGRLVSTVDPDNGTGRADLGASGAFRPAVATLIR